MDPIRQQGARVCLKTGGPDMTVERVWGDTIHVVWFDGAALRRAELPQSTLELATAPEPPGARIIRTD